MVQLVICTCGCWHLLLLSTNELFRLESNSSPFLLIQLLIVAEVFQPLDIHLLFAIEDSIGIIFACLVLYLSTTERVCAGQQVNILLAELGNHGVPDALSRLDIRFLELYLVEEPSVIGRVE